MTEVVGYDFEIANPVTQQSNRTLDLVEEFRNSTNWNEIEFDGWKLPATEQKRDDCGQFSLKGCLDVEAHKHSEFKGKVFVKSFRKYCKRASCEVCYKPWLGREANSATSRILKYQKISGKPPKHIVVSPPKWERFKPLRDRKDENGKRIIGLRSKLYSLMKAVKSEGGIAIYHPFRFNSDLQLWYPSPHFHIIGFGWIEGVSEEYKKNGWIVKGLGTRESKGSVFSTLYYQLSHCGVKAGYHSVTLFGNLSYTSKVYGKLLIEKEPDQNVCPACEAKLRPVYCHGLFGWKPPPQTEFEMWCDPEGWHILESKPSEKMSGSRLERYDYALAKNLYGANKGVSLFA